MSNDERVTEHRGKWSVRVDGQRYSTGLDARPELRETAERKARQIHKVLTYTPQGDTVADIMRAYLNDKHDDGDCIDPERLSNAWKRLEPHFGHLQPEEVNRKTCRGYHKSRVGMANGTINRELATLRAALTWHLGESSPAIFEMLSADEPRDRSLTRDEFQRLLEACRSPHLKLFCHLAIATAARKSAILELRWMMVRWDENVIWLGRKPNGKKRATVPITKRLRLELETAYEARESDSIVEYGGRPVRDVKHAFRRACDRAGISDFTIHDLRHTAAVWMCGQNVSLDKISSYLGHTKIDITRNVYAKYQPDHLRDAAAALEV